MPLLALLVLLLLLPSANRAADAAAMRPNLIWIMADDLGWGDLGCQGQKLIATPNLDRMAAQGLRFPQFYAGATVCAPSRSVLMTGLHHGHTRVRGNAGKERPQAQALQAGDLTVPALLKSNGYRTALIGKWGLGDVGPAASGLPLKQGFGEFFGYLNQHHAHNHFPSFLWENETKVTLPNDLVAVGDSGAGYASKPVQFADELFARRAVEFVDRHQNQPFFLYWSLVIPHANNERSKALGNGAQVLDFGPYASKDWPEPDKGQAAMIGLLDEYVGRLLRRLEETGLANRTLVIFTSDNGPHQESGHDPKRFNPSGPWRGMKRSLTDGGIRVPFIAWWPGQIKPGLSAHVGHFSDLLPTAAELAGAQPPALTDGISLLPSLQGRSAEQANHEFLYWEFHEGGFRQATLYQGRWKGIRSAPKAEALELYDLQNDPTEQRNLAALQPELVARLSAYLDQARSDNPDWRPQWTQAKAGKRNKAGKPKP
jgi:arylsulfatase A-like enzyme